MVKCILILFASSVCVLAGDTYCKPERAANTRIVKHTDRFLPGLIRIAGAIYFKPGATKEEVKLVMGAPTAKRGHIWYYGNSTVVFSRSVRVPVVTGYEINTTPLRVYDLDPFALN